MNKIKVVIISVVILITIPLQIKAASMWTGNGVYISSLYQKKWEVQSDSIAKVESIPKVFEINDISSYSAYISNNETFTGLNISQAFYWYNKSRLAYVKLLKVNPGQEISFLFSEERYIYCAEFDENFTMVHHGNWMTTGDKLTLTSSTEWIFVVFRNPYGALENGAGTDVNISVSDIDSLEHKYIIFEPFVYTFNLNGGSYNNSNNSIKRERLGVSKMTLPVPTKKGYEFSGWKAADGKIYKTAIPVEYNETLFGDATLEAVWTEIKPNRVVLDKDAVILEQNGQDTVKINATVYPDTALNKNVTWYSSDTKVATVDDDGNITVARTGKAVITAETANGLKASCIIYVMGFEVSVPSYCSLEESYEIKVTIKNNGVEGMSGRKRVVLETSEKIQLVRIGDEKTTYEVVAESSPVYNGTFKDINKGEYLVDTMDTVSVYYRLMPQQEIKKAGDYEGNVTFTVSVL